MKRTMSAAWVVCLLIGANSQAALVSVAGPDSIYGGTSPAGAPPQIVASPDDVSDDAAYNYGMQGFDEQQLVTLAAPLQVDGGWIAAGTLVNSHMIFLNTGDPKDGLNTPCSHADVAWTFDGTVLGVMTDVNGALEAASSGLLGATGTIYPGAFPARGFEGGDNLSIFANTVTVSMYVTEPGDWIRVVTAVVPEPSSAIVFGGLMGIAMLVQGRRRRR